MIGKYKIAALCLSRVYNSHCCEIIRDLNEGLVEQGYRLFVYQTCSDLYHESQSVEGETAVFDLLYFDVIDVVIIFEEMLKNAEVVEDIISRTKEAGKPVILIDGERKDCINVKFDYSGGFREIARHVINYHGAVRPHFMAGPKGNAFSETRLQVFKEVVEEHGIFFSDSMVSYGEFWSVPTINAMNALVASGEMPDAIICANDVMAITVCSFLLKNGYRVPQDIIVTGFDGIPDINFYKPNISSCLCSYTDLADQLVQAILQCEHGLSQGNFYLMPRLILSESCGCEASRTLNASTYVSKLTNQIYRLQDEDRSLNLLASRIQTKDSFQEVSKLLNHHLLYDMCCLLKEECIDETVNPSTVRDKHTFGERLYMLYNADDLTTEPYFISSREILPQMDTLLEMKFPLIFTAISMLNVPMGYLCFHYYNYSSENYYKIGQIVNMFNNALGGFRYSRYQQYLMAQLEDMYKIDTLTGLYNRMGFAKAYRELLVKRRELARESGDNTVHLPITAILADLDDLHSINNNYGHDNGDVAIHAAAVALKKACPEHAICCRFGGDEMFAVCMGECDTEYIHSEINRRLEEYNDMSGKPYKVSVSVGFYTTNHSSELEFEDLIRKSDKLMYDEKFQKKKQKQ